MQLGERDKQVYEYIRGRLGEGYAPSVREICRELGIPSTSTVHSCMKRLIAAGLLE